MSAETWDTSIHCLEVPILQWFPENALTESASGLSPRWKLVQQPAPGLIVPRLSFTPFFIFPTTCISQALLSNLRISFSLPLIRVIGSGFRCFTSLGHRLKL